MDRPSQDNGRALGLGLDDRCTISLDGTDGISNDVAGNVAERLSKAKDDFAAQVTRAFAQLTHVGMDPNQACALSLKIAAGMAEFPLPVSSVLESLESAAAQHSAARSRSHRASAREQGAHDAVEGAAVHVLKFFSSPESVHAAFWELSPATSSSAAVGAVAAAAPAITSGSISELHQETPVAEQNGEDLQGPAQVANSAHDSEEQDAPQTIVQAAAHDGLHGRARISHRDESDHSSTEHNAGCSAPDDTGQEQHEAGRQEDAFQELHLDLEAVQDLYHAMAAVHSTRIIASFAAGCEKLLLYIASSCPASNPGWLRQLVVLLMCPQLEDMECCAALVALARTMVGLPVEQRAALVEVLAALPHPHLHRLVITLQQYITVTLYQQQAITQGVQVTTQMLGLVHEANVHAARSSSSSSSSRSAAPPVAWCEFYNDAVNNEDFNLKEDFRKWKSPYHSEFSFCNHPYVYDPASKARVLQMECQLEQYSELHSALFRGLFSAAGYADLCPFLVLKVRRGPHLVQDTLVQVNNAKNQGTLRKPLKVKFIGEEGVDEGGVQKEFFQLLVSELFNPDYGMFTYDERLRLNWFRASHLDMDIEFELVGILIGLAIYNSHILEFAFPTVLYKLLTGQQPLVLEDLQELYPEVHDSLVKLLAMSEEDVQACGLSFQVDTEYAFGDIETVDLLPGQGDVPVTVANRQQYVQLYVEHLLEGSVARQLAAFRRGFMHMCSGAALSWFRPEELALLVCGSQDLDMSELEAATLYEDGYSSDSVVVRWFWDVVHHHLRRDQQQQLLAFVTGSDRVPIKGLAALNPPLVISRMGGGADRLPSAHTCFNHLLLPDYSSKEVLRKRLEMALQNCQGFGLV